MTRRLRQALAWGGVAATLLATGAWWWWTQPSKPIEAVVRAATGAARIAGAPARGGQRLALPGAVLETGPASVLSLQLEDGSLLQLGPGSRLEVLRALRSRSKHEHETELKLDAGEIQRNIPVGDGIVRRAAVSDGRVSIGVRGTIFLAGTSGDDTRVMVHRGAVALDAAGVADQPLVENQGTVARAGTLEAPSELLPPPATGAPGAAARVEELEATFAWTPVAGAAGYVVEVAADPGFEALLARERAGMDARLALALPRDGRFYWRVASVDARGLQGRGATPVGFEYRAYHARVRAAGAGRLTIALGAAAVEPALAGFPDDPALLRDVAWLEYLDGNFSGAVPYFDRALARDPSDVQALTRRGRAKFLLHQLPPALEDYQRALVLSPGEPDAEWGIAEIDLARGRAAEAYARADDVRRRVPRHAHAAVTAARASVALAEIPRAVRILREHLQVLPKDTPARRLLAELEGRAVPVPLPEPRVSVRRAPPDDAEELLVLGWIEYQQGAHAAAAPLYDLAVARAPRSAHALIDRGRNRIALGDVDGAEADFRAAEALAPGEPDTEAGLAELALARGDAEGAYARANAVVTSLPEHRAAPVVAARAALALGSPWRAEMLLRRHLANYPRDATAAALLDRIKNPPPP